MNATVASSPQDEAGPLGSRPLTDSDYRLMIDSVTDYAIFMIDINGVVRSWNAGARLLKGYNRDEVLGRHFSMFYPQELIDQQWPQHELQEATRTGRFEDEGWRVRKDGSRFWANIVITRLLDAQGNIRGFAKITRDLSGRRQQEELLRLSEERFRLLVDSVQDYAIFMLDPAGFVVSWNPGAEKNNGYPAAEIIGKHFSVFYPEEIARSGVPANELATALREGHFQEEGWRVRKDGTRFWAHVRITPVYDHTGRHRGYAKVTRDLTDTKKITALEDEGRRVTAYLAMLAHELRNPLAPISNALALMNTVEIESDILRLGRDVIDRQVAHMNRMVEDLLDISRITTGKITLENRAVDLVGVIRQAVEASHPLIQARQHHLVVKADAAVWVNGDHARLVQIITNLLNNAAKFTPAGGKLEVELTGRDGSAEIRVKDNGPGISEELRKSIFSLFAQGEQGLSREQGGLGIGLALSRQLAELHGGTLEVFSNGIPGAGSEFVLQLATAPAPEIRAARATDRKVILVADDNRDAANTLALLLEGLGYESLTAYDGPGALEQVLKHAPDLVLLDIGLPGMSGLKVAERIGIEMMSPPLLVAITGYGQERDREQTYKAGFHSHLTKPIDFKQLPAMLKRLLGT